MNRLNNRIFHCIKNQFGRTYHSSECLKGVKLISYERVFKMLENNMHITVIGQAVLVLLSFKVGSGETPNGNLLTSEIFGNLRKYEAHFTENDVISDKS